jgi:hypothetical protein
MQQYEIKNTENKVEDGIIHLIKNAVGFIVIYVFVLVVIPRHIYNNFDIAIFLTYFANVDIIANNLAINFPSYFNEIYDIHPKTIFENISYNIISLVALSGIFIYGLNSKNNSNLSDVDILVAMVIMSIVTWTMPTQLIPYLFDNVKKWFSFKNDEFDVFLTTIISTLFILFEFIIIHFTLQFLKFYDRTTFLGDFKF